MDDEQDPRSSGSRWAPTPAAVAGASAALSVAGGDGVPDHHRFAGRSPRPHVGADGASPRNGTGGGMSGDGTT